MLVGFYVASGRMDSGRGEKARNAVRTVMSAEAAFFAANGRYATLPELARADYLDNRYMSDPADLGDEVLVTLQLAPDQGSFQVEATGGLVTYVGDESGAITER